MPVLPVTTLVVATSHRGKLAELRVLLGGLPLQVRGIGEIVRDPPVVVEDGATFAENALKKARASAAVTGLLALADDSGLEVDALGGRPGVRSARFAGERATDAENNAALVAALAALAKTGGSSAFPARFRCVLALVDPTAVGERSEVVEGACEGAITLEPRGTNGFGYDPLFVPDGSTETMAELSPDEKNRRSHRARAFAALRPILVRLIAAG